MVAREVGHKVNQPNMMLAVAYAVANEQPETPFHPHPVTRLGSGRDDPLLQGEIISSAIAIRNYCLHHPSDLTELKKYLPKGELAVLEKQKVYPNWNLLFNFLKYRTESASLEELHSVYQMNEDLEYKMKEEAHTAEDFTPFLRQIKPKRYTYARPRRLCLYILLNIIEKEIQTLYQDVSTLLLGYNSRGRNCLKKTRKNAELPIISKVDRKSAASGTLGLQVRIDRLSKQTMGEDQSFGRRSVEVE